MSRRRKRPAPPPGGRGQYTAPILIGLTPEQREAVQAAAARDSRSVGEWARLTLLRAAESPV